MVLPSLELDSTPRDTIPNNCGWYALGYLKNLAPDEVARLAGEEQGPVVAALLTMPEPLMSAVGLRPSRVIDITNWEALFAELEQLESGRFLLVIRLPTEQMPLGTPPSHVMVIEKVPLQPQSLTGSK